MSAPRLPARPSRPARTAVRRALAGALSLALPVGLAATVVASSRPAPEPVDPAITPVAAAPASAPLTTFTLNVLHELPVDAARADIDRGMSLGDVGGFQEMSDVEDRATLMELAGARDYGWYMPIGGGDAIPIVWNRARFRLIEGRTTQTHGPVSGSPARYVNSVRLRELATGKVFGFINTHAISNASFDAQLSDMSKIPLLRAHLQVLRNEILALANQTENVFISGDLNVNYLADKRRRNAGLPTSALGDIVTFDMPNTGTRGPGSLLDYGMSLQHDGGLALQSSAIVYDFNSDHDAIQFRYAPVDVFAEGTTANNPKGDAYAKRDVVDRQLRALRNTEAGATVRLVTERLDDQGVTDQLAAARARGVNVQVVVGAGSATGQEAALGTVLGGDVAAPSFLTRAADVQTNALLVDRTGAATGLSLVASGPMVAKATATYGTVHQSTDDQLHATYAALFAQYAAGTPVASRTVTVGRRQLIVYPTTKDPMVKALKRVRCAGARGTTVKRGRTHVMVAVQSWSGARGKQLAQRLAQLGAQGCDVDVLRGKSVGKGIKRQLRAARVDVKFARISQNALVIEGRYQKSRRASVAWTGGPAWSDKALSRNGAQLLVKDKTLVEPFISAFQSQWKAS